MRIIFRIGVTSGDVDPSLYTRICSTYPEGRMTGGSPIFGQRDFFECTLPEGDFRLRKILAILEEAAIVLPAGERGRSVSRKISFQMHREYEDGDYKKAELLTFVPRQRIRGLYRTREGLLLLEVGDVKDHIDIAFADGFSRVVSDRLRRVLEKSGLNHLVFRPTVLVKPDTLVNGELVSLELPWPNGRPAFWELTSDFALPPFSPPYPVVDNDGRPFSGDCSNGCFPRDGLFQRFELHYPASAVASLEPFDLALTHEGFGPKPDQFDRVLVASKRLYKLCAAEGLPMDWIPVQIHDKAPVPRQNEFFWRDPADEPQSNEPLTSEEPEMKPEQNDEKANDNAPGIADMFVTAVAMGDPALIRSAIEHGVDVNAASGEGAVPVVLAAAKGAEPIVDLLIGAGADVNRPDQPGGMTALHAASVGGHEPIARKLIARGANVNATYGNPPVTSLSLALRGGHRSIARILLDAGADVEAPVANASDGPERQGTTPLLYAASLGDVEMVNVLLAHKADPNRANAEGMTPVMAATLQGNLAVAKALVDRGADVGGPGRAGPGQPFSAIQVAEKLGKRELVQYFREAARGGKAK